MSKACYKYVPQIHHSVQLTGTNKGKGREEKKGFGIEVQFSGRVHS